MLIRRINMAQLYGKKTSDGSPKALECSDAGELRVVLCATQEDGTVTPVRCDANGQIITVAGT